jgi:hypothetical protein
MRVVCGLAVLATLAEPGRAQPVHQDPLLHPQRFSVFEPTKNELHVIRTEDGAGVPAQPFQGFSLLTLELAGRSAADQARHDLAQPFAVLAGVDAIVLPGNGRLLRYVDPTRQVSGILHETRDGRLVVLLELPLVGGQSPLLPYVGVSRFEKRAAVVTDENLTGIGDLYLLRLDGRTFPPGQPSLRVTTGLADVDATSLTFVPGALFYLDNDVEVCRVDSAGTTPAVTLALPPSGGAAPLEVAEEFALAERGDAIAFLAGASEDRWDIYVATRAGQVSNVTGSPDAYEEVSLLTSEPRGPLLALNPDGTRIVYAIESPVEETEFFYRDLAAGTPPEQITSDARFEESVGDASTVVLGAAQIVIGIGESPANHDVYQVKLRTNGTIQSIENLTGTSGDADGAPWETGASLDPLGIYASAGGDAVIVVDDRSGPTTSRFDVWHVTPSRAVKVLTDLSSAPVLMTGLTAGSAILGSTATANELWFLPAIDAPANLLLGLPATISIRALSSDGADRLGFVASLGPHSEWAALLSVSTRSLKLLHGIPTRYGQHTRFLADGSFVFSVGRRVLWGTPGRPQFALPRFDDPAFP